MPTSNEIDFEQIKHSKLSENDDLSSFDCSLDDEMGINEFIHKEALAYQSERLGTTYLFRYHDDIVGFVTISMGDIRAKEVEDEDQMKQSIRTYPALYIGRLGVDNEYRGRDIGKHICRWCVGFAVDISERIGCRYVTLHTTKKLFSFYKRCNFKVIAGGEEVPTPMMYQRTVFN